MSEKKNLVVIGYGGMGGGFHCTHAQKSDVVSLAGIYDIDPEKRAKAEANGIKAYPTLEAVLEDRSVDLVTVAVPNDCHKDIVIRALEAGKNVICEKPVALNSEELEEMIAASEPPLGHRYAQDQGALQQRRAWTGRFHRVAHPRFARNSRRLEKAEGSRRRDGA